MPGIPEVRQTVVSFPSPSSLLSLLFSPSFSLRLHLCIFLRPFNPTEMDNPRFITLAIHTYHRAHSLKAILEAEGIKVMLQNVNLDQPCSAAGVRVRIQESDLPFALRIVENPEIFLPDTTGAGHEKMILVPVDFSELSRHAVDVAFLYASCRQCKIILLHAFSDPLISASLQLSNTLNYELDSAGAEQQIGIERAACNQMTKFCADLRADIKSGRLPAVSFTSEVAEGLPEEVIVQTAKKYNPVLTIMATRGAQTKERELIGSVTAEVLDNSRFPVLTVPPDARIASLLPDPECIGRITDVVMFVNFEQEDCLSLDALHRFLLPTPDLKISFVKIEKRGQTFNAQTLHNLLSYAERHYPECHFSVASQTVESLLADFDGSNGSHRPDLIVVPNKRKNAFTRLFNPGMAHRLLFHTDIAMMVLPV